MLQNHTTSLAASSIAAFWMAIYVNALCLMVVSFGTAPHLQRKQPIVLPPLIKRQHQA
jgi:hypothetical protein